MNTKQLIERIKENWPAKVICFVMAILIYFFYQITSLDSKNIMVPLTVSEEGNMMAVSSYNRYIKVTVRASSDSLALVTDKDIRVYLDLTHTDKPGTYNFPVLVEIAPHLQMIDPLEIKISPEKVKLAVEDRVYASIPITPVVSGTPAHGYQAGKVRAMPSTARISGPRSIVQGTKEIFTEGIDVEGSSSAVTGQVSLVNENQLITLVENPQVNVNVDIVSAQISKEYKNISVYLANLPNHLMLEGTAPAVDFILSGAQLQLEDYQPGRFVVQADCSGIAEPGLYVLPVKITVPEGIESDSAGKLKVQVQFVEKKAADSAAAAKAASADTSSAGGGN